MSEKTDKVQHGIDRHPLDYWTYHAYRRAKALNLPTEFIEEAREIVINAFGREWLESQFRSNRDGEVFVHPGHPIVKNFIIGGDNQLVEVIELAIYLKWLTKVKGLDQVVGILRDSGQFTTALLQIAYAYRFLKAGGTVELEPLIPKGRKSDIGIVLEGQHYLAECYVPNFGKKGIFAEILEYSTKKFFRSAQHLGVKIRLLLKFNREPTPRERTDLEIAGREAIIEASKHDESEKILKFVTIHVSVLPDGQQDPDYPEPCNEQPSSVPSEADFVMSEIAVQPVDLDAVKDGAPAKKERGSRILFRWPRQDDQQIEERVADLERRFDEKLLQTRSPGSGRILIAQVREGVEMTAFDEQVARTLLEKLIRRHNAISAIILTARVWTTKSRHRYQGFLLHGSGGAEIPDAFAKALLETDHRKDILQDFR